MGIVATNKNNKTIKRAPKNGISIRTVTNYR